MQRGDRAGNATCHVESIPAPRVVDRLIESGQLSNYPPTTCGRQRPGQSLPGRHGHIATTIPTGLEQKNRQTPEARRRGNVRGCAPCAWASPRGIAGDESNDWIALCEEQGSMTPGSCARGAQQAKEANYALQEWREAKNGDKVYGSLPMVRGGRNLYDAVAGNDMQ